MAEKCEYCTKEFADEGNVRPYGRNRERICFDCAMKPENYETTKAMLSEKFQRAEDASPVMVIGGNDGPVPLMNADQLKDGFVLPTKSKP